MPDLTPDDLLEIESDRRRRINAAFRMGSEAPPGAPGPSWLGPLAAGIAIAVAGALFAGVITLARASNTGQPSATPAVTTSPSR